MAGRQISDRERRWLGDELAHWLAAGLIEQQRIDRILELYETTSDSGHRKRSVARFTLMGISAFLVGLAALLLVSYNWDALHWGTKLAMIFAAVTAAHAVGFILRFHAAAPRLSEVAFLLGCLLYGAGIWLVAQIFHLDSHYPDGVFWWAVGVLPFALFLDTALLHVLLTSLLALWAGMEVLGFSHLGPLWFWPWWPNGAYSLPLLAAAGLLWAYRRGSAVVVGLYIPLLAWWVMLQALAWDLEWQMFYFVGVIGPLFLILAENHRLGSRLAIPYRLYGTLLTGGALAPLSFIEFQKMALDRSDRTVTGIATFAELIAMLVMVSATVAFTYLLRPIGSAREDAPLGRLWDLLRRQWAPFTLVLLIAAAALSSLAAPEMPMLPMILANVGMVGFAIWLMHVGLRDERAAPFASGVAYFLFWSILRYIDLFGEAGGMLGAAAMFFLCGAAMFALAMYWGKRKAARHA